MYLFFPHSNTSPSSWQIFSAFLPQGGTETVTLVHCFNLQPSSKSKTVSLYGKSYFYFTQVQLAQPNCRLPHCKTGMRIELYCRGHWDTAARKPWRWANSQYTGLSWYHNTSTAMNYLDLASQICPTNSLLFKKLKLHEKKLGWQLGHKTPELSSWYWHEKKPTLPLVLNLALTGWSCLRVYFRCYLFMVLWNPLLLEERVGRSSLQTLQLALAGSHVQVFHVSGTGTPVQAG